MIIGKIENGIVLDHIKAGAGMQLYNILGLDSLDCQVALIKNAESQKLGRKDIIKIDRIIDVNLDAIGYIDAGITVNIIENGKLAKRTHSDASRLRSRNCRMCSGSLTGKTSYIDAYTARAKQNSRKTV